jgi:1-acyl-sn-glycerol-3-phosphate acyltransferase
MQPVVFEKPYEFIPPHRGNCWPGLIQRLRLIDLYLRRHHGVVSHECRQADLLRESLQRGHGVMLVPNHCRPADPIVMGFLARDVGTHVYVMAGWHLYQQGFFTAWAIRRMGGFSVYREGVDRQALNTSIDILAQAERPLIVFPEGVVTRTNDRLQALLDGVAFMARAGAKKRQRLCPGGKVLVHPVALKYVFRGDLQQTLDPVLSQIEQRFSWRPQRQCPLPTRISQVGLALLALKEIEYLGSPQSGELSTRLQGLINRLLGPLEDEWLGGAKQGPVVPRIKNLRMRILPEMVEGNLSADERQRRWGQLADIYLAQQVASYPPDYLTARPTVDRLLETVERYEEDLTDAVRVHSQLHVIIQVGPAIEVDPRRNRSQQTDPLMQRIEEDLQGMLDQLAGESADANGNGASS